MFVYNSNHFTTVKDMNKEKTKLMDELCKFLGVDRKSFRLQQGNIVLHGLTAQGQWFPLTSRISDFSERVKGKGYVSFKLVTKLQVR